MKLTYIFFHLLQLLAVKMYYCSLFQAIHFSTPLDSIFKDCISVYKNVDIGIVRKFMLSHD